MRFRARRQRNPTVPWTIRGLWTLTFGNRLRITANFLDFNEFHNYNGIIDKNLSRNLLIYTKDFP